MTWDVHDAGSWGVAVTDTPAEMAHALGLPASWPINARRCFVRRDQWDDLTPPNPAPVLTSIAPNTGVEGDAVTVTATGTGFIASSTLRSSGGLTVGLTTYVNPTTLRCGVNLVGVPPSSYAVHVHNDPPGGGDSIQQVFVVTAAEE